MSFAVDREQLDQESEHLEELADERSLQEARMCRADRLDLNVKTAAEPCTLAAATS